MSASRVLVSAALAVVFAAVAAAQEPPAMQLTAEHKELEAWVGSWAGSGETQARAIRARRAHELD